MKKLLLKLVALAVVVGIACNLIFCSFHLPRFWGVCYDRLHFYETHSTKYNTLFIGSSLTRYQVNPTLFDSVNGLAGIKTSSYNFGVDGACPTEIFTTYKYLLRNKPATLNYVFVELTLIDNFDMGQLHSLRRKSSFGLDQYVLALPLTLESNYSCSGEKDILLFDFCHLVENIFKIGMLKDGYDFKQKRRSLENISDVMDYEPLPIGSVVKQPDTTGKYFDRHQKFLKESLPELKINTHTAEKMFVDPKFLAGSKVDNAYLAMARQMLTIADEKGVKLIFILPPRLSKENYKDLLPVYFSIPAANRIQLADANDFPDFYKVEYSYDIKHINQYCVPLYTGALAAGFIKLQAQSKP